MHPKIGVFYYINLERRQDREYNIKKQFEKYNITNYERINAINMPQKGYLGCSLSHLKTIETFLQSEHDVCVILEDDFDFTQSREVCEDMFKKFFEDNIEWDCVMLSSNTKQSAYYNDYLDKCIRAYTTAGYMINRKFATILLQNIKEGVEQLIRTNLQHMYAIDVHWMSLQFKSKWYIFKPKLGQQRAGYSDIEQRHVDYRC
jgi:GR25 family glycosyltransferase involved in LPS biosynthesis